MSNKTNGIKSRDLIKMGFSLERVQRLGLEFNVNYTPEIEDELKKEGIHWIWGNEGFVNSYATFIADNPEHKDYGEKIISLYSSDIPTQEAITDYYHEKYILDNIELSNYSSNSVLGRTREKLQYLADNMKKPINDRDDNKMHNLHSISVVKEKIKNIPSVFKIDMDSTKIIENGREFGVDLSSEEKEHNYVNQWLNKNAELLVNLMEENNINLESYDKNNPIDSGITTNSNDVNEPDIHDSFAEIPSTAKDANSFISDEALMEDEEIDKEVRLSL